MLTAVDETANYTTLHKAIHLFSDKIKSRNTAIFIFSKDIPFADREGKISTPVGLYLSEATRSYIAEQFVRKDAGMSKDGLVITCDYGENIERNVLSSLDKVLSDIKPVKTPNTGNNNPGYVLQVEIDQKTSIDIGRMAFSKKKVFLYMDCKLFGPDGRLLWEEMLYSENSQENVKGVLAGGGVLIGGIWGNYARQAGLDKLREAAEISLWANLEMLNTHILDNRALLE